MMKGYSSKKPPYGKGETTGASRKVIKMAGPKSGKVSGKKEK